MGLILTPEQILEVARLHALGVPTTRLAKDLGVSQRTAWNAAHIYAERLQQLVEDRAIYRVRRRGLKRERELESPPVKPAKPRYPR